MVSRGACLSLLACGLLAASLTPHAAFALSGDGQDAQGTEAAPDTGDAVPAKKVRKPKATKAKQAKVSQTVQAQAPDEPLVKAQPMPAGWLVTIRGNVLVAPDFPGAKNYGFIAYPSLSLRPPGTPERFTAPDDGVSLAFAGDARWSVGVVGRYQTGRYYSSDRALYGIQDAKWALEPGLYGEFWALQDTVRVRGELRYGINGYNGLVGNLGVDLVQNVGKFTLSGGPRMAIAGSEYMQTYFGVTPQDAALNGQVSAYSPDAGIKSVGVAAAATYHWNDRWATTIRGGYDRLVGPAADSPITRQFGSKDQFTFGANASYTFPLGYAGP